MKTRNPMFILYVEDMERAVRFYRETFELRPVMATPGWSMLRCGECTVALHIADDSMSKLRAKVAGLNFEVDDVEKAAEAVRSAGGSAGPVRPAGAGAPVRVCELRDPDGNAIEVRQFVGRGVNLAGAGSDT